MPSLLSSRRAAAEITLRATPARGQRVRAIRVPAAAPLSWPLVACVGGLVSAAASWALCAGITALGWFAADSASFTDALGLGTRFWLLVNGVGVRIGAIPVTLVPWGVTAVIAFLIARFAVASARRVRADQTTTGATIAVVTVAAYLVPVLVVSFRLGVPWRVPGRWAAVIMAFLLAALWLGGRTLRA
jgi:Family of unknown function (DUF6350)